MARAARPVDQRHAEASMLDQVRLYGGGLPPLPGTNREAVHIAEVLASAGGSATMLLGEQATIGKLEAAVEGRRYVHLATHGLTGSVDRPYDAGLALARPATPARRQGRRVQAPAIRRPVCRDGAAPSLRPPVLLVGIHTDRQPAVIGASCAVSTVQSCERRWSSQHSPRSRNRSSCIVRSRATEQVEAHRPTRQPASRRACRPAR